MQDKKYNVPTDDALRTQISLCQEKISALKAEIKIYESMLKLNEEGKAAALIEVFRVSLETKYTR